MEPQPNQVQGVDASSGDDSLIGATLGGYEIVSELATGGMGTIYKARHTRLEKIVALKVLREKMIEVEEYVERFQREALLAAKLEHPNIVRIYDYGQQNGRVYFVMQFVEGESLGERMTRDKRLPIEEANKIIYEVAKGLERAHEAGLVHRDIKPDNILISKRGEVLITDFGLVKQGADMELRLTLSGAILGTPYFMAPEQCEGLPNIDARADIYSLGLIYYGMITGTVPAEGSTAMQIMHNRILKDPTPPIVLNPEIPQSVNDLIMQMLVRNPDHRLPSAGSLLRWLEAIMSGQGHAVQLSQVMQAASSSSMMPAVSGAGPGASTSDAAQNRESHSELAAYQAEPPSPSSIFRRETKVDTAIQPMFVSGPSHGEQTNRPMASTSSSNLSVVVDDSIDQAQPQRILLLESEASASMARRQTRRRSGARRFDNRNPWPLIIVGALLVIVALLAVLVFINRGGDGSGDGIKVLSVTGFKPLTNEAAITINGQVNQQAIVTIAGESSPSDSDGRFERTIQLFEGKNELLFEVKGEGKPYSKRYEVVLDQIPPAISLDREGLKGQVNLDDDLILRGQVKENNPQELRIDGQKVELQEPRNGFEFKLSRFEGSKLVSLKATDRAGNATTREVTVVSLAKIQFESLAIPDYTNETTFLVKGKLTRSANVTIAEQSVLTDPDGSFELEIDLAPGPNKLEVVARADDDSTVSVTPLITCDTAKPTIFVNGLANDRLEVGADLMVTGKVTETALDTFSINGESIEPDSQGRFTYQLKAGVSEGAEVTFLARDRAGNLTRRPFRLKRLAALSFEVEPLPNITRAATLTIAGQANRAVRVRIDKVTRSSDQDGRFTFEVELQEGRNTFLVEVRDGRETPPPLSLEVLRDSIPPTITFLNEERTGEVTLTAEDLVLRGRVIDTNLAALTINGAPVSVRGDGSFEYGVDSGAVGDEPLAVAARDKAGNASAPRPVTLRVRGSIALRIDATPTYASRSPLSISGRVDPVPETLTILGNVVEVQADGRFAYSLPLEEGRNRFRVYAKNAGLEEYKDLEVFLDTTAPQVSFDGSWPGGDVPIADGVLRGQVDEAQELKSLRIGGQPVKVGADGRFALPVKVPEGNYSELDVFAFDQAGNRAALKRIRVGEASALRSTEVTDALLDLKRWREASDSTRKLVVDEVVRRLGGDFSFEKFETFSANGLSNTLAIFRHTGKDGRLGTELEMVLIPGGFYSMGSSRRGGAEEQPKRVVAIRPLLVGRYELRQSEWDVAPQRSDDRQWKGGGLPIEGVSWDDVQAWLKNFEGSGLRMPSESEWEYLCRAGSVTTFYWGQDMDPKYCWYYANSDQNASGVRKTHPGSEHRYQTNAFGLVDIIGNVQEWCQDDYVPDYKGAPSDGSPRGDGSGAERVVRGGGLNRDLSFCRSASRFRLTPSARINDVGARLVRSIPWPGKLEPSAEVDANKSAEVLADRLQWNKASLITQDQIIKEVGARLGEAFRFVETLIYERGGQRHRIATFIHIKTGIEFLLLPGGEFTMGEALGVDQEKPVHKARVAPFLLARYEMTQGVWNKTGGATRVEQAWKGRVRPLTQVSWREAKSWLSKFADAGLRLPSESEWEYACRAGTNTRFYWGENFDASYVWYKGNANQNFTQEARPHVGADHQKKANAFGLVDMLGNVWEWCEDDYIDNYNDGPADSRPRGDGSSPKRVVRGGSWFTGIDKCDSAWRYKQSPDHNFKDQGFRVAVTIPAAPTKAKDAESKGQ